MRPAIEVWRDAYNAFEVALGESGDGPLQEMLAAGDQAAAAVIEADRLALVAEIVAELRSGDRGYWTWRDYAADHIEAKFGGGKYGDR